MKNLATPFRRFLAWKIDLVLGGILPIYCIYKAFSIASVSNLLSYVVYFILAAMAVQIILGLLNCWLTTKFGGSIGKLLTGIRVVDMGGEYITFKKSLFRYYVGYTISGAVLGLGYWWVFKDKNRQTWHDQFVNTFVITKNPSAVALGFITLVVLVAVFTYLSLSMLTNIEKNQLFYQESITDIASSLKDSLAPSPTHTPTPTPSTTPAIPDQQPSSSSASSPRPPKIAATVESDMVSAIALTIDGASPISPTRFPWQNSDSTTVYTEGFITIIPTSAHQKALNYFINNGFSKLNENPTTHEQMWVKNASVCILSQYDPNQNFVGCSPKPSVK